MGDTVKERLMLLGKLELVFSVVARNDLILSVGRDHHPPLHRSNKIQANVRRRVSGAAVAAIGLGDTPTDALLNLLEDMATLRPGVLEWNP